MPRKPKTKQPRVYQLKVTIKDTHPPVWRRVRVPGNASFLDLHDIIETAFGWDNDHMHEFVVGNARYRDSEFDSEIGIDRTRFDEARSDLEQVIRRKGQRFRYTYDFGDDWRHDILVEKIEPAGPGGEKPVCIAGKRRCPPEDCGGPWNYAEFLEAIHDPAPPEHEHFMEWVEDDFDPEEFDIEAVNRLFARYWTTTEEATAD